MSHAAAWVAPRRLHFDIMPARPVWDVGPRRFESALSLRPAPAA